MRRALLTLALIAATASSAAAQRPEVAQPPAPFRPAWQGLQDSRWGFPAGLTALRDTSAIRPTHWLKGGIIGGLIGGGSLAIFAGLLWDRDAGGAPSSRESAVVSAALLGGFGGFIIGALIGGASPKSAAPRGEHPGT